MRCSICPESRPFVTHPDTVLPVISGFTCGAIDAAGRQGTLEPTTCGLAQGWLMERPDDCCGTRDEAEAANNHTQTEDASQSNGAHSYSPTSGSSSGIPIPTGPKCVRTVPTKEYLSANICVEQIVGSLCLAQVDAQSCDSCVYFDQNFW